MRNSIDKQPIETLQQLGSQCADVVAEICRSVACNSDLVDAIRNSPCVKDTAIAFDSLRKSYLKIDKQVATAVVGILLNLQRNITAVTFLVPKVSIIH
jgi:hypothetical protein